MLNLKQVLIGFCMICLLLVVACAPVEMETSFQQAGVNYYLTPEPTVCTVYPTPSPMPGATAYPVSDDDTSEILMDCEPDLYPPTPISLEPYPVPVDSISTSSIDATVPLSTQSEFDIHMNLGSKGHATVDDTLYWYAKLENAYDILSTNLDSGITTRLSIPDHDGFRYLRSTGTYLAWYTSLDNYSIDPAVAYVYNVETGQIVVEKELKGVFHNQFDISDGLLIWSDGLDRTLNVYDFDDDREIVLSEDADLVWPIACTQSWVVYMTTPYDTDTKHITLTAHNIDTDEKVAIGETLVPQLSYPTDDPPYRCDQNQITWREHEQWRSFDFNTQLSVDVDSMISQFSSPSHDIQLHERVDGVQEFLITASAQQGE